MSILLVDSTRRLRILADENAFIDYCNQHDPKLKRSNMLELIGKGRVIKHQHPQKYNHMLLKHGVWLAYEGSDQIIPLFGSYKHMHETLSKEHGITFAYTTFRDLVGDQRKDIEDSVGRTWSKRSCPAAAFSLGDGASLASTFAPLITLKWNYSPSTTFEPARTSGASSTRHESHNVSRTRLEPPLNARKSTENPTPNPSRGPENTLADDRSALCCDAAGRKLWRRARVRR